MWIKPTAPVIVLMSMMGAFGFVSKLPGNLGWAMLPECSDYAEWKFGKRGDGLLSSSLTFINKFGMAIGGFIASFFPWISWIRGKSGSDTSGYQYDRILKIRDANLRIYRILNFHVLL